MKKLKIKIILNNKEVVGRMFSSGHVEMRKQVMVAMHSICHAACTRGLGK